jgi:4-alpha-glucanotransferase
MRDQNHGLSKNHKQAGVLLHISSLPSAGSIGDLGECAYQMVDQLADMQVRVWQTLPINMPHADRSPYQCISAFAGDVALISLENLVTQKLLQKTELKKFYAQDSQEKSNQDKSDLLHSAYTRFVKKHDQSAFLKFCENESVWLEDFALFLALRQKFNLQSWNHWPEAYKNRDVEVLNAAREELAEAIAVNKFSQFIFFEQWHAFRSYANEKKVALFGDIPIFVAFDSAEVWAKPHLFKLDEHKNMTVVAGVPPDYFSETGQRWGNPHYHWENMAAENFAWWVARLAKQSELFDLVRIDHFRGLEAAWEIPVSEETAINGAWVLAPGDALLETIFQQLPNIHLVAEDLGIITPEVDALRLKFGLPGMKILQFAFGGDDTNPYLPQNIQANSVAYTGTHDNDTTLGWYTHTEEHVKAHLHRYLNNDHPSMPQALIAMALESPAYLTVIPWQDVLGLGSEARMNIPGTVDYNWCWRFTKKMVKESQLEHFKTLVAASGRAAI